MLRLGRALLIAALLSLAAEPGVGAGGSRAVVNLPDGRLLAVVGQGGSQSVTSRNGAHHIVVGDVVIEFMDGQLTVDGEAREVPPFKSILEIRIMDGEVELIGDP